MRQFRPEARRLAAASAAGLVLVIAVLLASAAIRHGAARGLGEDILALLRGLHRGSATLEVVALIAAGWAAWQLRAADAALPRIAALAAGLTIVLAVLGAATGRNPPPAAAAVNLVGGLALAAAFAWALGRAARPRKGPLPSMGLLIAALAAQCVLGAWVSLSSATTLWSFQFFAHAALGTAISSGAFWRALHLDAPLQRFTLLGAALAAPAAGLASAMFGQPLPAMLAHAAIAASLVVAAAYVHGGSLDSHQGRRARALPSCGP